MKKILKENYIYVLVFIFFFLLLLFFNVRNVDTVWNYGMAHAIRMGEVPYRDFNIITTPLYAFIMSIFLFLKDTYGVYLLEQAFFCTVLFYFIHRFLKEKTILYFFLLSIPFFTIFLPNYNFLAFLLFIIILFCEKEEKSDFLIGFLLGLLILTKHTIGVVVLFFSLLSTFQFKRMGKRLLFSLIPIFIFCLYLFLTQSFSDFINLSILGLFDFGKSNQTTSIIYLIISICIFIYNGYLFYNDKKDKWNYYLLSSFSFIVPIINMDHCCFLIGVFLLILLYKNEFKIYHSYLFLLSSILVLFNFYINVSYYQSFRQSFSSFQLRFMNQEDSKYVSNVLKKYQSYEKRYMISMDSMLYDIESNHDITYFDIPLYGNFGYNGINYMKDLILSEHDSYFFVQDSGNSQFANELCDFVRENGELIEEIEGYQIYYIS